MIKNETKTCLVAIGNPLRSNDGVAACVGKIIEEINLPAVTIIATQQLNIAMAQD